MNPDELVARAALMGLRDMGPNRARWLLSGGPAGQVIHELRSGRPHRDRPRSAGLTDDLLDEWTREVRGLDLAALATGLAGAGVALLGPDDPGWPFALDPDPPIVLFCLGRMELLAVAPRVALVGTRRCSAVGRQVAFRFGRDLARAGVVVVSGLASGIDTAAHRGALEGGGPALGVVGSGLDVVYPRSNRELWARVGSDGLLLSEAPLGAKPRPWRFPARNRLIAGLAEVVVVVESHARGGALLTAGEAADRGRTVMAVPGAVTSPSSVGSNRLLIDGCPPACGVQDVLDLLGVAPPAPAAPALRPGPAGGSGPDLGPSAVTVVGRRILDEVATGPVLVDAVVAGLGLPVVQVLAEVQRLVALGLVELDASTIISV